MRKRNRLMAALAAAAAVSLSILAPATAANAVAPPDSWSAIGQVTNTGTCANNEATFTVSVPTVGIDAEMQGGFTINGTSANVENFAVGVISPFTKSVTVDADVLPATYTVSYWLNTPEETLFANEYTFDGSCQYVPPTPKIEQIRSEGFCVDTTSNGEVRVAVSVPEGVEPFPLNVLYGAEQSLGGAQTVSTSGEYRFQGPLPVGDTPFTVTINGLASGEGVVTVASCEPTDGGGGNPDPGDGGGGTPGTVDQPDEEVIIPIVPVVNEDAKGGATGGIDMTGTYVVIGLAIAAVLAAVGGASLRRRALANS